MQVKHRSQSEHHLCVHNYTTWLGPCKVVSQYFTTGTFVYMYCMCCLSVCVLQAAAALLKFVVARTSRCALFLTLALKRRDGMRAGGQADSPVDPGFSVPAAAAAAAGSLIYHFYYLIKNSLQMGILFLAVWWGVCRFTVLKRLHYIHWYFILIAESQSPACVALICFSYGI